MCSQPYSVLPQAQSLISLPLLQVVFEAQQEESTSPYANYRDVSPNSSHPSLKMGGFMAQSLWNGNHELYPEMLRGKN